VLRLIPAVGIALGGRLGRVPLSHVAAHSTCDLDHSSFYRLAGTVLLYGELSSFS
jgi:hypothetical protein